MPSPREIATSLLRPIRWSLLGGVVGVVVGVGSALFLIGLYWATATRESTPWLLWLLPLAGLTIGWLYDRFGRDIERGTKLLLDRVHGAGQPVPWKMAPMITLATIGTHLFGGSAGREGTAVQMGGSLADWLARLAWLDDGDRRLLLISGISGGFGAVFGTPLAGTVFGLEVLSIGRVRYEALVPCLVASTVGDLVCRACGIEHHLYPVAAVTPESAGWLLWVALSGIAFGIASLVFVELTDSIQKRVANRVVRPWLRPFYGGLAIVALTYLVGSRDYLGLSLPLIDRAFAAGELFWGAFALKLLFTAVTLGTGFKGGEVTPLFCIGATLGHTFASLTGQSTALFAALGFVAVFAGAAKTPLACALMGIELFGADLAIPLMIACVVSYLVAGPRGIYSG